MELRDLAIGALAGGLLVWLALWARYAARLASATTERDVLRERVVDLEATVSAESETAALVAPLAVSLDRVAAQVHTLERDRGEQFARVAVELARVQSSTGELRDQTASLVGSLASANVRGSWGEVTLRRVLEVSGLLARCDFEEQVSVLSSTGAVLRPDVVVHLPGERIVAVDAKTPMTDFLAAQAEGVTAAERSALLKSHAKALRGHVDALAGKGYWTAFDGSPELVVCFVPGEALLAAALQDADGLFQRGFTRQMQEDWDGARADYDQAIALQPGHAGAWLERARVRVQQGDLGGALGDADEAVRLAPQYAWFSYIRAGLRWRANDPAGAEADYARALELDASLLPAYLERGNLRYEVGNLAGARADYEAILREEPEHPDAVYNLACVAAREVDVEAALDGLARAVALAPTFIETARQDPDWEPLRDDPRWQAIVGKDEGSE